MNEKLGTLAINSMIFYSALEAVVEKVLEPEQEVEIFAPETFQFDPVNGLSGTMINDEYFDKPVDSIPEKAKTHFSVGMEWWWPIAERHLKSQGKQIAFGMPRFEGESIVMDYLLGDANEMYKTKAYLENIRPQWYEG